MWVLPQGRPFVIHHHTGGLEKQGVDRMWTRKIHHHTGGLEKHYKSS